MTRSMTPGPVSMRQRARARARRRVIQLAGASLIAALTAACIFDKSDYEGGGRLDKGATAGTVAKDAAEPVPTDSPTATSTGTPDSATPPVDAAGLGD